jgi:ABC-type multidrug transport system fused ATPase/permease subunit
MRQALSMLNGFAAESFAGARDIQLFGAAQENERRFEFLSRRLWNKNLSAVKEYAFYNPIVPFITGLMDISILGFGGWLAYRGEISVGHIVAFLSYASYFGWPIREFAEKLTACQQAASAVDRLIEFGSHSVEINQGKNLFRRGLIEFNNLSFRYADELPLVLKNINFSARPGEKIALMGETGSGKTTTCSLLLRFYEPTHGQVSIAGIPASEIEIGSLRKNISWISQDIVLFSESIRENIRFFNLDISDEDIWKVLELVQLSSWVSQLPGGLDFVLTERGDKLSAGQRQLLSMARALVGRPSILIFDEATSAIDVRTEAVVQSALERLWQSDDFSGITTFIIAHRLTTIRRCDRLYVYRDGAIVESGTYRDIVAANGYGASLFKRYSAPLSELREIQIS